MMETETTTNCPKCNAPISAGAEECPQCGILYSKWQQRAENVASGNLGKYNIANATSSEFNWTILLLVCGVIVAIFYYLELSNR